jgi:hypothetical protein
MRKSRESRESREHGIQETGHGRLLRHEAEQCVLNGSEGLDDGREVLKPHRFYSGWMVVGWRNTAAGSLEAVLRCIGRTQIKHPLMG